MLLRVLRPVTYLGSSLFALAILVKNDQARKASKPFQLSQVVVPPKDVAHVREAAARLGIPHTQNIFVVCSRSLSAFSGGNPERPGGAVVGLPLTFLTTGPNDRLWDTVKVHGEAEHTDLLDVLRQQPLPSRQHKDFTIMHELVHVKEEHSRTRAFFIPIAAIATFESWFRLARSRFTRPTQRMATGAVAIGVFGVSLSLLSWFQEMAADVGAARVGRDVCEGGLESLQAHEDAVIAVTGNPPLWPSPTHPPLRWRQAALRRILKEYDA